MWILHSFLLLLLVMRNTNGIKRVVVVGGGAAGYFSAIECAFSLVSASETNYEVIVLEAGRSTLQKVLISGGGRCNVMHDSSKGAKEILKGYPRGLKELTGPFMARFGPLETMEWFTSKGVKLKVENDGRVFPVTDKSSTVVEALEGAARRCGVQVRCLARVTDIKAHHSDESEAVQVADISSDQMGGSGGAGGRERKPLFTVSFSQPKRVTDISPRNTGIYHDSEDQDQDQAEEGGSVSVSSSVASTIECDRVIMASGSNRAGYEMLQRLGHQLSTPVPSLFSFKIKDKELTELSGVSCQLAQVKLVVPKSLLQGEQKGLVRANVVPTLTQTGPLLITHQGLSGPAVLRLSSFGARVLAALEYKFDITVNWLPELNQNSVNNLLWEDRNRYPNRLVGTALPSSVVAAVQSARAATSSSPMQTQTKGGVEGSEGSSEGGPVLSKRLWQFLLSRAGVLAGDKWDQLGKADVSKIASQLTGSVFAVSGRGLYRDEFVTCGGVKLNEVNFDSMESKKVKGLYLAERMDKRLDRGNSCGLSLLEQQQQSR